jgi:putative hydrolase of the HAD superfamily
MRDSLHSELVTLFQDRTHPLEPQPTSLEASLPRVAAPVQAVLFDVYGTLISSGVGDISLDQSADQSTLIQQLIETTDLTWKVNPTAINLAACFNEEIQKDHIAAKELGIPHPEVDILEIWSRLLSVWTNPPKNSLDLAALTAKLAIEYECTVNPVWPNEACREILDAIRTKSLSLGIVSNAQFYTPIMLEAFLGNDLTTLGFAEDLRVWSYQKRRGKPDPTLYHDIAHTLKSNYNIAPEQTLFVGNDMLKDIWAATQAGFKGVLFAGDARSLRLREDDVRCRDLKPYATVTSLSQINQLLP